jgi:nitric-oxide synthase
MLPSCYGCGAALQDAYDDVPGYVDAALLAEKRLHRQLDSVLCSRCRLLAQGDFLPVVQEASTGLAGGRAVITPQQLREQLKGLADRPALIVKLVDMTDVSGSFLTRVRSLVGRNPLILVGTKADLLPKGTDGEEVKQWLAQTCDAHGLTVIGIHLISSRTGAAVDATVRAILSERKGRDVFVLGAANVGKSLFIQAFLKTMAAREGLATLVKYQPLASATPGTTLGMIALDVFSGGSCLHDTPGVHLHHRVTARLPPDDVKALAPRAPLRGIGAPVSPRLLAQLATGARGRRLEGERGWSVLWGGFLRVDLLEMPACARLVFFGPKTVTLRGVETAEADAYYEAELGRELTPPATAEAARGLGVMEEKRSLEFRVAPGQRTIDVAVSGLGWFSVVGVQQSGLAGDARIRLWSPRAVELFVRKPMPVRWADFEDSARDAIALDGDGDDDDGFDALGFEGDEFDEDELD